MNKFIFYSFFLHACVLSLTNAQDVSTYAGMPGQSGFTDGAAASAKFNRPHAVCVDKQGNVYVADRYNHRIRKISTSQVVSTLAGSGLPGSTDGTGTAATFNEPWAIACDTSGNLYIADTENYKIRKVTPAGVVTTIAGTGTFGTTNGTVATAQFGFPAGIAVTKDGSIIYVADRMTSVIRKIQGGQVTTLAGTAFLTGSTNGTGAAARFDHPYAIICDNAGNIIVADEWNNMVRKVTPTAVVTTMAGTGMPGSGNGNSTTATFDAPWGIAVDSTDNIYVGDGNNYTIRKISTTGVVSTYAGVTGMPGFTNGPVNSATFSGVTGLAYFKTQHALYVADAYNQLIRKVAPVSTVAITISSNSITNTFCSGSPVILTASPAGLTNYIFKEGTTTLGTSANGVITLTNLAVGVHNIFCTAVDGLGNTITSSTINITIVGAASATISPSGNQAFCQGDSVMLTASAGVSYLWSNGKTTQSIYAISSGSYSVTVTVTGGCSAQSTPVTVTMNPYPASVQATGDSVCVGENALLTVVQQSGVGYYWYAQPSGGTFLYAGTAYNTPALSQTTPYYIELRGSNGCINPNRSVIYAIVQAVPVISFETSIQTTASNGLQVYFMNTTTGGTQYSWNFGDTASTENISTQESPTHTFSAPGEYTITLVATNAIGCVDTLYRIISVSRNNSLFIPTAFTPNNDGNNDIFRVRGVNIKSVSMKIFNQWGQSIYTINQNYWDGKVRGDLVQNGTYVYVIDVTYANDISETCKGQVTVIR